jgi:glycosyltransferase involved in cell wall biosynthesis
MTMENKIWLDVTTILNWNRSAVGIIRVESETASYFLNSDLPNVCFCRFDMGNKQYQKVSREEVQRALDTIRKGKPSVVPEKKGAHPSSPPAPLEQRVKNLIIHIINVFPWKIRQKARKFASDRRNSYHAAEKAYHEIRLAVRTFISSAGIAPFKAEGKPLVNNKSESPFKADDVYISLGLDWDHKDYLYLFLEKKEINFKIILICYDIIPVKHQQLFFGEIASKFAHYFADLAWCADRVLCISECTKRDLTDLLTELGTPIPPMSVIKLGCELLSNDGQEQLSPEVAPLSGTNFIMLVSTIERRKNHEVLYRSYTRLAEKGIKRLPLLVFVGMPGWGVTELLSDLNLDARVKPYVRILNHVSDGDLAWLYQNAEFTVFPSLYEGWGIPVAESLAAGKFCLASTAASIPEVGGDLIEYLDPWDLPSWENRLQWYFEHPEVIAEKNEKIRHEYTAPKWGDTALFVLKTAEKLLPKQEM